MKILSENESVIFTKAEVLSVNYNGRGSSLYSIKGRLIDSPGTTKIITASPLDFNLMKMPIVGEVVIILIATAPTANKSASQSRYYYLNTVAIQNNYHHNALPTISDRTDNFQGKVSYEEIFATGVSMVVSKVKEIKGEPKIDKTFPERNVIAPLQLYSGDMLIDGRFGNSIRFTSTPNANSVAEKRPTWGAANSVPGDPLIIISNGRKISPGEASVESPNSNDSSIWLSSGQSLIFNQASSKLNLFYNNKSETFLRDSNSAKQIFLTANRINLNAKEDNINIFSKKNVGITADKIIHLEATTKIELEAEKIALGINATHPALLGDVTFDLLTDLTKNLIQLCDELIKEVHPTGVGPSGPPQNAAAYGKIKANLNTIKSKLPDIKSNLVFLNKSYLAQDSADEKAKEEFNNNKESS